jgi:hypothetical protein
MIPGISTTRIPYSYLSRQIRDEVIAQHGSICHYCFKFLSNGFTVDHETPLSRGGTYALENLVPCCRECNGQKDNMTAEEFALARAFHSALLNSESYFFMSLRGVMLDRLDTRDSEAVVRRTISLRRVARKLLRRFGRHS